MNKTFYIGTLSISAIVSTMVFFVFTSLDKKRIVTVDANKVFQSFKMTQEMKSLGEKRFKTQARAIDSLSILVETSNDVDNRRQLMMALIAKKDSLTAFEQKYISSQSERIWTRINEYSKLYAQAKSFDLIVSNHPQILIYGTPALDVTTELINFLNKKYEGAN